MTFVVRGKRRRWLAAGAAVLIVAVVATVVAVRGGDPAPAAVATVKVARGEVTSSVAASGKVAPVASRELAFPVGGTLTEVLVKAGDEVTAGQRLAVIDDADAQAARDDAANALTEAEQTLADARDAASDTTDTGDTCVSTRAAGADLALDAPRTVTAALALSAVPDASAVPDGASAPSALTPTSAAAAGPATLSATPTAALADLGTARVGTSPLPVSASATPVGSASASPSASPSPEPSASPSPSAPAPQPSRTPAPGTGSGSCSGGSTSGSTSGPSGGRGSGGDAIYTAEVAVNRARATLGKAERDLAGTTITAPVAAKVLSVGGRAGDEVGTGTFLTLGVVATMMVQAEFAEADAVTLAVGQAATVTLANRADEPLPVTVAQVAATGTVSGALVRYQVLLAFDGQPEGLLIGQSATAAVVLDRAEGLLLPQSAVRVTGDGTGEVKLPDGTVRAVGIGLRGDGDVLVTSGLAEGDAVRTNARS